MDTENNDSRQTDPLGIDVSIGETLQSRFGFDQLRPGQQPVIQHLLNGHSAAAVFPTGGGKSLCYQLPALLLEGITLVVSPLIALMKDQIDALERRGIRAARLDSSLNAEQYRAVMNDIRSGSLKLLYVSPERFNNERFRASLSGLQISLFAVDEAHCLSEWGHNFRPDYLKLARYAAQFKAERVLALTATATPKVLDDICRVFDIQREHAIRTGFYRANLHIDSQFVTAKERDKALIESLRGMPNGPGIIYVTLQSTAETLAEGLAYIGFNARAYHAGMDKDERHAIQEWFMSASPDSAANTMAESAPLVVATIAFGMGVDKADIRHVHHYNLPKSLENYSQEIGRAGRDGKPSRCVLLACTDDLNVIENFIYGDSPDETAIQRLIDQLFNSASQLELNLNSLSSDTDIRPLVLRTLLTYLELDGYLEAGTPFYASYQFRFQQDEADILAGFNAQRRDFLSRLFAQAEAGRTWSKLDVDGASRVLNEPRKRIISALDWLGEQQMLEVRAAGVRHRYRIVQRPDSLATLTSQLHARIIQREASELKRLQQIVNLVTLDSCQTNALAAHFGEHREQNCQHCGWCEHGPNEQHQRADPPLPDDLSTTIKSLRALHPVLEQPRALTRFLCGISSPQLSRAKIGKKRLGGHAQFGSLSALRFSNVLRYVSDSMSADSMPAGALSRASSPAQ